jgi:hypothetical protein
MLGLDGSFGQAAAFLEGVNAGQGGSWLAGFREWLIVQAGVGFNLTWRGLVLHLAFPSGLVGGAGSPLSEDDDKVVTAVLFRELDKFLEIRNTADGLVKIYDLYLKWLRKQEWYEPGSPNYLD